MIENYIDQIITMEILADAITIIDDKGIIRYFRVFRAEVVPVRFAEIVGRHFLDVYPGIKKEKSTVLKALRGEPTFDELSYQTDFKGGFHPVLECVYPIRIDGRIIGAVCVSRNPKGHLSAVDIKMLDTKYTELYSVTDIVGISTAIQELKMQIMQVSETDANVLIYGETGSGKELVAQSIHSFANRKKTFISQNCAAIPATLLEGIFFGTEKGIYTGSVERAGLLEKANGGTIFLDEINSLDISIQAKLLKALEEKKVNRLGSDKVIHTDFRVIAAMNEDPFACLRMGKIRNDLFYRLGTVILNVPPLRKRRTDIPVLCNHFINKFNKKGGHQIVGLSGEVQEVFQRYDWPGNVRELKNIIENAFIFSKSHFIEISDLPPYLVSSMTEQRAPAGFAVSVPDAGKPACVNDFYQAGDTLKDTMDRFEAQLLRRLLEGCSNHSQLAKDLNISRQTLLNKINKYSL